MKRGIISAAAVAFLSLPLFVGLKRPSAVTSRPISLKVTPILSSNDGPRRFSVAVSNLSDSTLQFVGSARHVRFAIKYLTNGTWGTSNVLIFSGGPGLLAPHDTLSDTINVPPDATAFTVGLDVTSLTWRGRLAWSLLGSRFETSLHPIMAHLIAQDEKYRSRTEWSEEFAIGEITTPSNAAPNFLK